MIIILRHCILSVCLILGLVIVVNANHIVGGELQMKPTGAANTFEVTLIQFWDQNNLTIPTPFEVGNRDESAELHIFRKRDRQKMASLTVRYLSSETMTYQNKACANIRSLNTTIGTYRGLVTLNPQQFTDPEGYYIAWERCCRNDDINNIKVPGDNGMVFYLEFPPLNIANSSANFVAPNGQYICSNRPFAMNMSATDADGDELRYSLVIPLRGTTTPNVANGDGASKVYPLVDWINGITINNVIPGPSPLKIDNKGQLTVTANQLGLYVFTIQCEEFRNGQRIGLVRRDFQLLVIDCNDDQPSQPVITHLSQPVTSISYCPERPPIQLQTENSADWSYQWQLNGLNISGATTSTLMVSDTGNYSVIKSYTGKCSRDTTSLLVNVKLAEPIPALLTADKEVFCNGQSVTLTANGGQVVSGQVLSWTKDAAAMNGSNHTVVVTEPGMYCIKIEGTDAGCSGMDTMIITKEELSVSLPERQGVVEGSSTQLNPVVTPAQNDFAYAWSPTEGLVGAAIERNVRVSPAAETVYTVSVTSPAGCVAEASVLVYVVEKMHIPTAFSPDNDGHNDTFEIFNSKDQIVEMRIYNRWGTLIFQSDGYNLPWDGSYKGAKAAAGSYPYIIRTFDRELNGTVLLLK